jgi:dihydrofolate reductase
LTANWSRARQLAEDGDVLVLASTSIVHQFAAAGAVNEYRLLVFPTAIGTGQPLIAASAELKLTSAESAGPAVLLRYSTGAE